MKNLIKQMLVIITGLFLVVIGFGFKYAKIKKNIKPAPAKANAVKRSDFNFRNIEFDFNKATIRKSYYSELDMVASKMQRTKASLKVSGNADNRGSYLVNWKLSAARAQSVKRYIASKGCDTSKIAATEFGDTKPIASNKTKTGRQKNRRVEIEAY